MESRISLQKHIQKEVYDMAKASGEKTNLYLLAIVAIVAVVGIVVLILNSESSGLSTSSSDYSGEAVRAATTSMNTAPMKVTLGSGKSAISVSLSDCGNSCDICGCDANGEHCKCQD